MSFIQCSVCEATVDAAKAYCPECGSAMDEEEKRTSFSEFDQLMKTQNINSTTHFRLMEQFKLSSVFKPPQGAEADQNLEKNKEVSDANPAVANIPPPEKTSDTKPAVVSTANAARGTVGGQIENKPEGDKTSTSNKKTYIIIGAATFFLALFIVSAVLIFIYWFYLR